MTKIAAVGTEGDLIYIPALRTQLNVGFHFAGVGVPKLDGAVLGGGGGRKVDGLLVATGQTQPTAAGAAFDQAGAWQEKHVLAYQCA